MFKVNDRVRVNREFFNIKGTKGWWIKYGSVGKVVEVVLVEPEYPYGPDLQYRVELKSDKGTKHVVLAWAEDVDLVQAAK